MAIRANWKGFLKIGEVACAVALYTAASTSERIAFHTINRITGHRVRRVFIDSETESPVDKEDQIKGYETSLDEYVLLEPEEVAAAVPESDKTLEVTAFIGCQDIDKVYFDKPYYLTPSDKSGEEAFALIREGMRRQQVAAIAQTVLFRRVRTVLIRAHHEGMIATTLNFDYEVRPAQEAFRDIHAVRIEGEMLELAEHIIATKMGRFDAAAFDDRYEAALADLVRAKLEGKIIEPREEPQREKVIDLMAALRESANLGARHARSSKGSSSKGTPNKRVPTKGVPTKGASAKGSGRKASQGTSRRKTG